MFFRTWVCLKSLQAVQVDSLNQFKGSEIFQNFYHGERTSRCASKGRKGSLTVEAALAFPLFLLAVTAWLYLFLLLQLQTEVGRALTDIGREQAQEAYGKSGEEELLYFAWITVSGKQKLESYLEGRATAQLLKGGVESISYLGSGWDAKKSELTLRVSYQVSMPMGFPGLHSIQMVQEKTVRGWTGYQGRNIYGTDDQEDWVYMTTYGTVYHRRLDCRHLKLSIQQKKQEELGSLRNTDGAKYYPCERCGADAGEWVYITEDGSRYHANLNCSSLLRGIYMVRLSETGGVPACSACGG